MPLRPRGAQALTSGCLGSRTARNSGSLSRLGAVACAYHEPLIRLQEKDDCLGLALSLLAGLSVPRSSTCGSQPCQSLYRPPLHWPVRPSLVHLSTGLSVPLSSTSLQACRSLSRPPLHRPVSPSLVHLSTDLTVPLSSTSSQVCQSLSRPPTSPQTYQSLARPHLHTSPHPMRLSLHMNRGCLVGDSLSLHSVFCRASPCIDSCTLLTVLSFKNLPVLITLSSEAASLH